MARATRLLRETIRSFENGNTLLEKIELSIIIIIIIIFSPHRWTLFREII